MTLIPTTLSRRGILGLNRRNIEYISACNPRRLYPRVDDKTITKSLAQQAGVAVPELYFLIGIQHQLRELPTLIGTRSDFVIKPACGSGGEGVLVIASRFKENFRLINGDLCSPDELSYHISRILSGVFSLGGQPDKAICEYRVKSHPVFDAVAFQGVPDVRIVVYLGVPVMAMVRLPTRGSQGKANLHQGAVGVGIDLAGGFTMGGVWRNRRIDEHPDTGHPLSGMTIPEWPTLLKLAAGAQDLAGLGYLGVDIVIDRELGPLLLELNARPGLNIQIANNAGLLPRLRKVAEAQPRTLEDRVAFALELGRTAAALWSV